MNRVNSEELEMDEDGIFYWKRELFTGTAFDIYPNGQVSREVEIVKGFPDGYVREWFPSGERKFDGYEDRNEQRGWGREWFPNGMLKRESTSERGIRIKDTIWNEAGEVVSTYEDPTLGEP